METLVASTFVSCFGDAEGYRPRSHDADSNTTFFCESNMEGATDPEMLKDRAFYKLGSVSYTHLTLPTTLVV